MLRGLVVLLVVANGVFFAWTQNWLAPALPARTWRAASPSAWRARCEPIRSRS